MTRAGEFPRFASVWRSVRLASICRVRTHVTAAPPHNTVMAWIAGGKHREAGVHHPPATEPATGLLTRWRGILATRLLPVSKVTLVDPEDFTPVHHGGKQRPALKMLIHGVDHTAAHFGG